VAENFQLFQFLLGCFIYHWEYGIKEVPFQFLLGCFLFNYALLKKSIMMAFNSFWDASIVAITNPAQGWLSLSIPSGMLPPTLPPIAVPSFASFQFLLGCFDIIHKRLEIWNLSYLSIPSGMLPRHE